MRASAQKRIRARVTGRVQGVYFRASTRQRARSLGVVGWVRNTRDGAVEVEAEGTGDALDQLLAWCRRGPPAAAVRDVEVEHIAIRGDEPGFEIRY